jgi:hypothetical protein
MAFAVGMIGIGVVFGPLSSENDSHEMTPLTTIAGGCGQP